MTTQEPAANDNAEARLKRRATMLEVNGRRVNEAIERGGRGGSAVFVCECGNLGCGDTIELSIAAYESVRTDFDRFLVLPGHEIDAVDRVVERHPAHLVVVKRGPEAKAVARAADQRTP